MSGTTAEKDSGSGIVAGTNDYLVNKLLKGLLIVSIIMMLGATVSMSVDNIVAGNMVGENALAAMNVVMPLFVAISMVSSILANGGSALAARYLGQNKPENVNSMFTMILIANLLLGVIIIACVYPNMHNIAEAIGARDEAVKDMAVEYMIGLLFGVLPILFNSTLTNFIRVAGNLHLGAISVLIMSAVNITLDIVLAGPMRMSMFGLALATSAGYIASCIVSVIYLFKRKCSLAIASPRGIVKDFGAVVNMGLPSALTSMTSVVRGVALNVIVAIELGTIALNAMSALSAVSNFVSCASLGVGFAVMPLIGIFYGEQDRLSLQKTMKRSILIGFIINVSLAIIISILARPLSFVFNITDETSVRMVMRSIWFFAVSMPFAMVSYAFVCYYQNAKRVWLANTIIICKVVFILVFTLPFIGTLADNAIWLGSAVAEIMSVVLIVIIVWIINKKLSRSMSDVLLTPEEWDASMPCYEVSLKNNLDDCVGLSENIQAFCQENGASRKVAYYSALCLEEMAVNTIQYGFKDGKEHFIDIKVILSGDMVKLRIRDDGIGFNPFDYLEKQDAESEAEAFKNIGIRLVKKLAHSVDYRYTMRLNNLFVEVVDSKVLKLEAECDT